jgi:hypothetical protein
MLKIALVAAILAPLAARADAPARCIPEEAVICTIDSFCDNNTTAYYQLKTSYQKVNVINVDANISGVCQVSRDSGAALEKLKAQAEQLRQAGVCKVVINNIE